VLSSELLAVAPTFEEELSLRHPGRSGPVDPAQLASVVPTVSSRLVVFVHGLVDTEQVWFPSDERPATLPAAVEASGATPLFVRYATGRPIERNGRDLDAALEAVVTAWPVPITSLTLVGHSMGGLLLRAACAAAVDRGSSWLERLDDLLYLGTPHLGSWLEKLANVTSWTLRRTSRRAAPIGSLLDRRSQGIKDLRFGTTEVAAWPEGLVDGLLTGRPVEAVWLDGARHHLVVGRLHADPGHPVNAVLGDALVRASSATGAGRWRRIEGAASTRVTAVDASHVGLPRHSEVAAVLREVLAAGCRAA
jgi:pimeloyl-ACP methyl ester carboxylesterase